MAGAPDLFVVCKNCQSEVSPYITECPYCGQRLRKRAPKLDREGRLREPMLPPEPEPEPEPEPPKPRRRLRKERPPKLQKVPSRRREPEYGPVKPRKPVVTIALVLAALLVTLAAQATLLDLDALIVTGDVGGEWWRLLTTSLVYTGATYQAIALTTVAIFGWLLERRHGGWATGLVYVLATLAGSALVVLLDPGAIVLGAHAAALALLSAWAVRDLLGRRRGDEDDADMLGVAVWLGVLLLLPLATVQAHVLAGFGGLLTGALLGLLLARLRER